MSELTLHDYKKILEFYKRPIPNSSRLIKANAEKIISSKLCRCVKKFDKDYGPKSVGMCTKSVINSKGFVRGKFTCKKRGTITLKKMNTTAKRRNK